MRALAARPGRRPLRARAGAALVVLLCDVTSAAVRESDGFLAAATQAAPGNQIEVNDVSQTVGQRIAQDSGRIGLIAENLVGVQGDINRVEKEVLGKVFDLQTMKSFFSTHEATLDENKRLNQEVLKENAQIESLSKQLAKTRADSSTDEQQHRLKMAQVQATIAEDETTIQSLASELKHEKLLEADNEKLTEVNGILREQTTRTVDAAQQVHNELDKAKAELEAHQRTTSMLQEHLITQHKYAETCHLRVNSLEQHLKGMLATEQAEKQITEARVTQTNQAVKMNMNMLVTENAALKERLEQAKAATMQYAQQLADTTQEMSSLQHEATKEIDTLKSESNKMKQHISMVENSLMTQIHQRMFVEKQLGDKSTAVKGLQQELLKDEKTKLTSSNGQLKKDLDQMHQALLQSQVSEAKAEAQAWRAEQEQAAWKATAQANAMAAQQAAKAALEQVAQANGAGEKAKSEADQAAMAAEASVMTKCSTIWDDKHKELLQELEQCKGVDQKLKQESAQVEAMHTAVASAQA